MKKRSQSTDQAMLRALVNKKNLTFAQKRLIKDLSEIQKDKVPTVNVTAKPLDHDLFTWHANIRGPEGTLYQGGIFHLELHFPQSYPHHPPTVKLFTTLQHPNVFSNYICLDMIQYGQRNQGTGWSSAYSVQSVLFQLQSFLFEQNLIEQDKAKLQNNIKKAVKEANQYKCTTMNCSHGGRLSCWPAFHVKEQKLDTIKEIMEEFITIDEENQLIKKDLVCFHTKLSYSDNQLGLGLKVSKIPRTGNIREAEAFYDYISVKAYLKESIRMTSANQRMTHWFPVYFGKIDNESRFLKFFTHAVSMIMTNSTKNFQPQFILEVLPKLFMTQCFHIMSKQKHPSIRLIRILTHLHSIFLFSVQKYPQLKQKIKQTLEKFLQSQENRNKDNVSNLGCILALLSVQDQYKFSDVAQAYFSQQLDRQVLWILKAVPELIDESLESQTDQSRIVTVFKSQIVSFHIFCFYKLFITHVCETRKTRQNLWELYNQNLCKLSSKEENEFQSKIKEIQSKVVSFEDFFAYTGLKKREEKELNKMLKQAIKNSQRKRYHGEFEIIHQLASSEQQFKKLLSNAPTYKKYFKIEALDKKEGEKKIFQFKIQEKASQDDEWKKMCIERWNWVKEIFTYDTNITAKDLINKAINYSQEGIAKAQDRLMKVIRQNYLNSKINYNEPTIRTPDVNWKKCFLALDLEDFLLHIDMNPDFPEYYEKLEVCNFCEVNTLLVPFIEIRNVKSGYYYITVLLSKIKSLKYLEFSGLPNMNNILNEKAAKALMKGFTNFNKSGGKLEILSYYNLNVNKNLAQFLFSQLNNFESLISLRFKKTNFFNYGATMKVVSSALTNLKHVQELTFVNCQLNQQRCKTLADSLMRMKKLKIFTINDTNVLGTGLSSIIYNLAFSPNMLMLNLSSMNIGTNATQIAQIVVSLTKLLKISASIEIIKANYIPNLNNNFVKDFWLALGENSSLRVLDLSFSGPLNAKKVQIGNAIAFNARKKGSLQYLNTTGCFSDLLTLNQLYKSMNISDYDQEKLYGDPNKLTKMIASNYKSVYYNNLKALQLDKCTNFISTFNLSHFNKLITKEDPNYVKILARSSKLESVQLSGASLNKNFAELLVLALDPRRAEFCSKIKVLDLSKNNLNKDGIKALSEVLAVNNIVEVLDLSKNKLGVSGAHELSIALKKNTSLKFLNLFNNNIGYDGAKSLSENVIAQHPTLELLEVGHNRIRDKGLKSIVDALISNEKSSLKIMGLRFNFLTNVGITYLYNKLSQNKNKIQQLFIDNNLMDDRGLSNLEKVHEEDHSKIAIDSLRKIKYLEQDRSERTVWIHPIQGINLQNLKRFFQNTYKCGIVLDIRIRKGKIYPGKKGENIFGFVQFADAMSVTRCLHIAAQKLTNLDGINFRVYKAGTGTFLYSKKTSKQKKVQFAQKTLPPVPYNVIGMLNPLQSIAQRGRGGAKRGGARRARK